MNGELRYEGLKLESKSEYIPEELEEMLRAYLDHYGLKESELPHGKGRHKTEQQRKAEQLRKWYRRKFVIDDFKYEFVEQYMMSRKAKLFHDSRRFTAILRSTDPQECKDLGKLVTPFDSEIWDAKRIDIVMEGNRAKFGQNPDLLQKLLDTGNALLVEASPWDKIWGIGMSAQKAATVDYKDWPGENLLGKILMELREDFRIRKN